MDHGFPNKTKTQDSKMTRRQHRHRKTTVRPHFFAFPVDSYSWTLGPFRIKVPILESEKGGCNVFRLENVNAYNHKKGSDTTLITD